VLRAFSSHSRPLCPVRHHMRVDHHSAQQHAEAPSPPPTASSAHRTRLPVTRAQSICQVSRPVGAEEWLSYGAGQRDLSTSGRTEIPLRGGCKRQEQRPRNRQRRPSAMNPQFGTYCIVASQPRTNVGRLSAPIRAVCASTGAGPQDLHTVAGTSGLAEHSKLDVPGLPRPSGCRRERRARRRGVYAHFRHGHRSLALTTSRANWPTSARPPLYAVGCLQTLLCHPGARRVTLCGR